jgi:hypothetical protein
MSDLFSSLIPTKVNARKKKKLIRGIAKMYDTIQSIRFVATNCVEVYPNDEWIGGKRCPVWFEKEHYRNIPSGHLPIIGALGWMLRNKVVTEMKSLWMECLATDQTNWFEDILKKHLGAVWLTCGIVMHHWIDYLVMEPHSQRSVCCLIGSIECFNKVMTVVTSMSSTWFYSAIGTIASVRRGFTDLGMRFLKHDVFLWANDMPSYVIDDVPLDEEIVA